MLIKLWDWDKKWQCSQVFEGHSHYVMMIVLNPKDNNQFVSASLDRTIKVGSKNYYMYLLNYPIHSPLSLSLSRSIYLSIYLPPSLPLPPPCRYGSWVPPSPTSLWRAMRRASTVWTTSREGTNLTSYQEQMTGQQGLYILFQISCTPKRLCTLPLHMSTICGYFRLC